MLLVLLVYRLSKILEIAGAQEQDTILIKTIIKITNKSIMISFFILFTIDQLTFIVHHHYWLLLINVFFFYS